MTFVSYAQNDEDILLWRALKSVEQGFYIDVGAAIIDDYSVSRAFYEHGWRGVNIEPVPELCERVRAARPEDATLCVALGAAPGEREFFTVPETGLSTLSPVIAEAHREAGRLVVPAQVRVKTLAAVCREHAKAPIHYLKIDVEGGEADVLAGADFAAFRPWILVIEATWPGRPEASHAAWEPGLMAAGYRFVWFDGLNRFYIAVEQEAALAPSFLTPPNIWDGFVRFDAGRRIAGLLAEKERQHAAEMAKAAAEAFGLRRAYFSEVAAKAHLERRLSESAAEAKAHLEWRLSVARAEAEAHLKAASPADRPNAQRGALKSLLRPCWRLLRPILRPLAWRARGFLLRPVHEALAELRTEQERLAAEAAGKISAVDDKLRERLSADAASAVAALLKPIEAALTTVVKMAAASNRPPEREP